LDFGLGQVVSFFPGGRPAVGVPVPWVLGQSFASGSLGGELFGGLGFPSFLVLSLCLGLLFIR
jgi:hypothetical protein